jgi:HEAT repeats
MKEVYLFPVIIYTLLILLFLVTILVMYFTIRREESDLDKIAWQHSVGVVIVGVVFIEGVEEGCEAMTHEFEKRLNKKGYKNYMINELIKSKRAFSGSSADSLKLLYERLNLDTISFGKLHHSKWHIRAKGIQELGIMEQTKYRKEIFWLANDGHELVRNEAQCAMVSFFGWSGLSFLNAIEHQMSQWHQVQLLDKLSEVKPDTFKDIREWMESTNESVIVFAIKLATLYKCHEVYQSIVKCLQSPNSQVKISALEYLRLMPQEDTSDQMINNYYAEDIGYKLAVITSLKDIGSEKEISFLVKELDDQDNDIKAAAANSLSILHPLGNGFFSTYPFAKTKPWKEIFLQITNKKVA